LERSVSDYKIKYENAQLEKRKQQQQFEDLAKLYAEQQTRTETLLQHKKQLQSQLDQSKLGTSSQRASMHYPSEETKLLKTNLESLSKLYAEQQKKFVDEKLFLQQKHL
jgi:Glu-tRNA(Gln) amidotransferase subunit E-like FAD-binding protein